MVDVWDEDVEIEYECRNAIVAQGVFEPEDMGDLADFLSV